MSSSSSSSFSSSSGGKRALERLAATVLDHDAWTFASTRARDAARRREVSAAVAECAEGGAASTQRSALPAPGVEHIVGAGPLLPTVRASINYYALPRRVF